MSTYNDATSASRRITEKYCKASVSCISQHVSNATFFQVDQKENINLSFQQDTGNSKRQFGGSEWRTSNFLTSGQRWS